jgi:hypothetical protein
MQVYAFTGKRGMGKSTAAEVLVRDHGYVHLNFADPLREVCHIVYGVSFDEMTDPILKEKVLERWPFKAPRELLQQIGTDMFRNYIPETWVERWKMTVRGLAIGEHFDEKGYYIPTPAGVVCSDCRFLNEAQAVHAMGAKLIKIEDPRKVRTDVAAQHQSETEIDLLPVDWTITNNRTIHDLEQAVLMLCTDA